MSTGDPLVSILIPTYNRARMLAQSLRSAQGQTYGNVEIVVADNCSQDGTAGLVADTAGRDDRIRSIRHDHNIGYLGNIGALLSEARGTFVKFLMDDDLLMPDCVESLARPCILDASIGFATSKRTCVDEQMNTLPDVASTQAIRDTDGVLDGLQLGDLVLRTNLNVLGEGSTTLFRRELLAPGPGMLTFGQHDFEAILDVSLWLKVLSQGNAFYSATPKSLFRRHGGQGGADYIAPFLGVIEWGLIIPAARQFGFLADVDSELEALGTFIRSASQLRPRITDTHHREMLDESIASAGDRLASLAVGRPGPEQRSADGRASRALREISREDALTGSLPVPRPSVTIESRITESRIVTVTTGAAAGSAIPTAAETVVMIEPSMRLRDGWLPALVEVLDAFPNVDAVAGARTHADGRPSASTGALALRASLFPLVAASRTTAAAAAALQAGGVAVSQCPRSVVADTLPPPAEYRYDISIVISMLNPGDVLLRCLGAIEEHTAGCSYEVVMVDHGSTDATRMLLECLEGDVQILQLDRQAGGVEADGITAAVWMAQGRDLVFLPPAAEVGPGWLSSEAKLLAADDQVGALRAGDAVLVRRAAYVDASGLDRLDLVHASGTALDRLIGRMQRRGWRVTPEPVL